MRPRQSEELPLLTIRSDFDESFELYAVSVCKRFTGRKQGNLLAESRRHRGAFIRSLEGVGYIGGIRVALTELGRLYRDQIQIQLNTNLSTKSQYN